MIDFVSEVGQIHLWGLLFVDLAAVGFAGCSGQKYQR
jgi:hypothetical protein